MLDLLLWPLLLDLALGPLLDLRLRPRLLHLRLLSLRLRLTRVLLVRPGENRDRQ